MKRHALWIPCAALLVILACDNAPNEPDMNPAWLEQLIAQIEREPVTVPPTAIYRYTYRGETVYYRSARCCDIRSVVYAENGAEICEADGGIDGGGDGRCPDFHQAATGQTLVYQDPRKPRPPHPDPLPPGEGGRRRRFYAAAEAAFALSPATTSGQPSRTLGYFGVQSETDLSFLFEMRSERDRSSPRLPRSHRIQNATGLGGGTPKARANESKYSRRVIGSSSTTL